VTEPTPSRPGRGAAATLLAALLALFFLPALASSDQFLARDSGILHHPTKRWIAGRWSSGELPAWNPLAGLGVPEVSGSVDAVLHPFNLALVALPYELGFKAWVLLSFLAAALGAFAMARALGCGWHASVAAGLGFALSGHLVGSSDNLTYLTSLAFLPWLFAAGLTFQSRPGPATLAGVGLASALCAAGGDPQAWGFAILALPLALLALPPRGGSSLRRRLSNTGLALGAAVAAAAPLWLPVLLWLPHSSRAAGTSLPVLAYWDLDPRRLIELVIPNLLRAPPGVMSSPAFRAFTGGGPAGMPWVASIYFGATALLLAGAAAVLVPRARRLLLAAAAFTWLASGAHLGFGQLARQIPVLGSFRYWEKLFIWPTLLVVMAAAMGFDALLRAGAPVRRRFAMATGLVGISLGVARMLAGQLPLAALRLLTPGPPGADGAELVRNALDGLDISALAVTLLVLVTMSSLVPRLARFAPALLLAAVAVDPFSANGHAYALAPESLTRIRSPLAEVLRRQPGLVRIFDPFEPKLDRWPDRSEVDSGFLWAARTSRSSWNLEQGIGNLDPYAGLLPAALRTLRQAVPAPRLAPAVGIWSVSAIPVPGKVELAARAGLTPPFEVIASDEELPVFLVKVPSRPRAYLAEAVTETSASRAQEETLALPPASTRTVLEGPVPAILSLPRGETRLVVDLPERVVVEAVTDRTALLVLNDQHAPGWSATVDGVAAPILRANLLVRALWLPPGQHRVEFTYRTPGLAAGAWLAGLLAVALAGWGWTRRRKALASS
jgi:hypothetical protein